MPPKRTAGNTPPPPGGIDFRASDDDAWYGVRLRVERSGAGAGEDGEEHCLRVMYCNFPEVCDERFASGGFADEKDLEEFSRRFRASSVQLQDWECGGVVEGMTICASYVFGDNDVRFYDAVVEEVCFSDHKIVERDEVCTCTFVLLWLHGPNAGKKTSTGIEHVCLLKQQSKQIDPELDRFLELSRKTINSALQNSCKETRSSLLHNTTQEKVKGRCSTPKQWLKQDIYLESGFPDKSMNVCLYFVLIENLEKDVLPQTIVDFIYQETSIWSQACVSQSLLSESHTRGAIFLETKEKADKLLSFLQNPAHIIVSSRGRPWVLTERKLSCGSAEGLVLTFEKQLSNKPKENDKIKVVHAGTKEYMTAKQLQELFIEFHDHVQCLHQRLALEERKLLGY